MKNFSWLLLFLLAAVSDAHAGCTLIDWHDCNIPVVTPIIKKIDQVVTQPVTHAIQGVGTVLEGVGKTLTGSPEGPQIISRGFTKVGQAVVEGVPGLVTLVVPVAGAILIFGSDAAKLIYDVVQQWKGSPNCRPEAELGRLMTTPKKTLNDFDRLAGTLTTGLKYLSSLFNGPNGWERTGCDAVGIGKPIRAAQKSSDGFWTIDVELAILQVGDKAAPPGRFIRLEIMPGTSASTSAEQHQPTSETWIGFKGPLVWDHDTDGEHPNGHMEIHPSAGLEFVQNPATKQLATIPPVTNDKQPVPVPLFPATYEVRKGDCLSTIAARFYGRQLWQSLYRANRKSIRNPDLIYPAQVIQLPAL